MRENNETVFDGRRERKTREISVSRVSRRLIVVIGGLGRRAQLLVLSLSLSFTFRAYDNDLQALYVNTYLQTAD